jgi:hypothetical protein
VEASGEVLAGEGEAGALLVAGVAGLEAEVGEAGVVSKIMGHQSRW